jgi:hypothetical protein
VTTRMRKTAYQGTAARASSDAATVAVYRLVMSRGVWKGVVMDSLKYWWAPLSPTLLHPVRGPSLKLPFLRWPARRAGGLQPSSTPLDTPRRAPMAMSHRCFSLDDQPRCRSVDINTDSLDTVLLKARQDKI